MVLQILHEDHLLPWRWVPLTLGREVHPHVYVFQEEVRKAASLADICWEVGERHTAESPILREADG